MEIDVINSKKANKENAFVIVGGSDDTKEDLQEMAQQILKHLPSYNVVTFTFQPQKNKKTLFKQQVKDLQGVIDYLTTRRGIKNIIIFCTSLGAYSTCFLLNNKKRSKFIRQVIFFDPADYYTSWEGPKTLHTWSGAQKYSPYKNTCSDLLKNIYNDSKIHVVHLTLKNFVGEAHIPKNFVERGKNLPNGSTRLNSEMVKGFYLKTPKINRGKYIEDNAVPHAFVRDGDVQKNQRKVVKLVLRCLKKKS